jgi:hypothetical protein
MYHPFSVAETIKTAWNVLKRNFIPLIVYSVISLFIYEFVDFLKAFILIDDDIVSRLLIILMQMVVQAYIGLSFYKLILTLMDREYYEFEFKDILPSFKMAFNFIVIGLLLGILFAFLFFFYVVAEKYLGYPRIFEALELILILYIGLRCIFCICFIVDDNSDPWESLKQSFEITKDNFFKTLSIFIIIIAILALVLIPVIAIMHFFGLDEDNGGFIFRLAFYCWFILTFPFIQVIIMVTYRKLVYSHLDVDDDIAETN